MPRSTPSSSPLAAHAGGDAPAAPAAPAAPLPASAYLDDALAAREHERLFEPAWHYVGHAAQLAGDVTVVPAECAGVPILLVREPESGEIAAYVNACRHRGTLLATEASTRSCIQCPYHAWTWNLDGTLRGAPRMQGAPGFEPEALGLVPVRLERWGPLLFACLGDRDGDGDGEPLAAALGEVPRHVAEAGIDVDALVHHSRWESTLEANWKVVLENYLECYHCQVAHPEFSSLLDVAAERYELVATPGGASQFVDVRGDGGDGGAAPLTSGPIAVPRGQFHVLYPAVAINVYPGAGNLSIGTMRADGAGRTHRFLDYFFSPDAEPAWIEELLRVDEQVGEEDRALVERVQAGLATRRVDPAILEPRGERLVAHVQQLWRERMDVAGDERGR